MTDKTPQNETPESGPTGQNYHFERSAQEKSPGLISEFGDFLLHNKKWWLTPIIIVLLALAALVISSPAAAPFIYTLF